jgi:hypothetical protein
MGLDQQDLLPSALAHQIFISDISSLFRPAPFELIRLVFRISETGTSNMKNAHERFGRLVYVRRTEKASTNIRLIMSPHQVAACLQKLQPPTARFRDIS